ncbi:MAG: hypothetical protein QM541_10355 [Flavobacterium sp.]|nr:hypothetical protein [Flavobacterium sp.]
MDEIVDFLASNILTVALLGVLILLLKLVVVYLLIKTKKPKVAFTKKSVKSIFNKTYSANEIKKSKKPFRVFLKNANNSFKLITYVWLILLALSLFFSLAAYINNYGTPIENTDPSTPTNTE